MAKTLYTLRSRSVTPDRQWYKKPVITGLCAGHSPLGKSELVFTVPQALLLKQRSKFFVELHVQEQPQTTYFFL